MVCMEESFDTSSYFLEALTNYLGHDHHFRITFMSDRQKGLINAVKEKCPNSLQRHCPRHLYANFRKKCPGVRLRQLFWKLQFKINVCGEKLNHNGNLLNSPKKGGRQKMSRRKEQWKIGGSTSKTTPSDKIDQPRTGHGRCGFCKELGHNRLTCPHISNEERVRKKATRKSKSKCAPSSCTHD
ncbi:hypothetical protein LIER_22622 [Lithospermum erythrorhizon]|uniref:Uncharacterized protein n=1 Tax=Lithospermum erythrorhizon TaxID=34254 RepID=A0AAV3QY13_LITER